MNTISLEALQATRGKPVYSSDGEKIGRVEEVFVDDETGHPEWIGLGTGFFGTKRVLVPVAGASTREGGVLVPYSKDHVKDTPDIDDDHIDHETERLLYSHYGLEGGLDTGLASSARNRPDSPGDQEDGQPSVTRSEEELRVGKETTEAGRLRLHKWTETEQVDVPVELRREKARVTREPVDGTVSTDEIGDESLEVTLREERAVVAKEAVAKERIGIEKDVETETETVSESLRKERVDVEGDGAAR